MWMASALQNRRNFCKTSLLLLPVTLQFNFAIDNSFTQRRVYCASFTSCIFIRARAILISWKSHLLQRKGVVLFPSSYLPLLSLALEMEVRLDWAHINTVTHIKQKGWSAGREDQFYTAHRTTLVLDLFTWLSAFTQIGQQEQTRSKWEDEMGWDWPWSLALAMSMSISTVL